MKIEKDIPEWQYYENRIYNLFRSTGHHCEKNVILKGARGSHQIDILLQLNSPLKNHLWLVECKNKSRPIGKADLQSFKTVIDDIGADHGYLISESGFQSGTKKMARTLNITLTSFSLLSNLIIQEQLDVHYQQSKEFYVIVKQEEDWGNMDSEAIVEMKAINKLEVLEQLIEIHIFLGNNLHWILPRETFKRFVKDDNTLKMSIPWDIPNLELEAIPLEKGGSHFTGRLKSGEWACGSYNMIFRTFSGPINIIANVPGFK